MIEWSESLMATNTEPERAPARAEPAYLAGRRAVLGMPRWTFSVVVILAIVVGNVVRDWLVSKYSLPRSEAFLIASIAVILYGLTVGVFITLAVRRGSRREIH